MTLDEARAACALGRTLLGEATTIARAGRRDHRHALPLLRGAVHATLRAAAWRAEADRDDADAERAPGESTSYDALLDEIAARKEHAPTMTTARVEALRRLRESADRYATLERAAADERELVRELVEWLPTLCRSVEESLARAAPPAQRRRLALRRRRERWFKVIGVLGSVALAAIVVEIALRVAYAREPVTAEELAKAERTPPPPIFGDCAVQKRQADLGDIVRPTGAVDVVYELKPSVDTCFYHARTTTNAEGLRAPRSYARPKPPGTWRIVLLGDSYAFGRGVPVEQTLAPRLEAALAKEAAPGTTVEVVNAGVPGYNTAMEAGYLAAYGLAYEPDCVVVFFCGNDLELPHLMLTRRDPTYGGSYLFGELGRIVAPRANAGGKWYRVSDPEGGGARVPPEYRHMIGFDGYRRALSAIAALTAPRHVPVVDFADYDDPGVRGIAPPATFVSMQRQLGILVPTFHYPYGPEYTVSAEDGHPNAAAHGILAEEMLAGLHETGVCLPPRR